MRKLNVGRPEFSAVVVTVQMRYRHKSPTLHVYDVYIVYNVYHF